MKKLFFTIFLATTLLLGTFVARASFVNCILCGNTSLDTATLSYAVITGVDFLSEITAHSIGFLESVPGGTLDAIPNNAIAGAGISASLLTGDGRHESTLFVDPWLEIVSPGTAGGTTGLSAGSQVDFLDGLDFGNLGPCLGSAVPGIDCSDATARITAPTDAVLAGGFALSPIPVPAAVWLFGTALIGFIAFSRRRNIV